MGSRELLQSLANDANDSDVKSKTFGRHLREQRESRGISLRKFAKELQISAAFLVDLEKDRRKPNPQLLQKIADQLDVPASTFDEFSPYLPKSVREWAEGEPVVTRALSLIAKYATPEDALGLLERGAIRLGQRRFAMAIYESELQAIGLESSSWDSETGGDLFGIWAEIPIVYLATRSGPNSVRDQAHFRLDVDYLIRLSVQLEQDWGLRYFGDWHSHHRLELQTPSGGDRARIQRLASKNAFQEMAEFIVTFSRSYNTDRSIRLHPYAYLQLPSEETTDIVPIVLTGISPVRDALAKAQVLPEQHLSSFSSFSLDRVVIPKEPLPRVPGNLGPVTRPITDRVIRRGIRELEVITPGPLEIHETSFGYVLVAPLAGADHIAFAIDGLWPHRILQIDRMNRTTGTTRELDVAIDAASMVNVTDLIRVFRTARESLSRVS